jgi:hypothetical protein
VKPSILCLGIVLLIVTDSTVRAKMKERYGEAILMEETVISPGEMFASEALILVAEC